MKRRLLPGILSILIICSALNFTAFGVGFSVAEPEYADTSEWLTASQIAVLYRSGVSQWETISGMADKAETIVTRGQAASYISSFAGLNSAKPKNFETLFKDLTSEHKDYAAIKAMAQAGYMQGDPDGFFRPDEPITTMETATVLLRCLNYQPIITMAGANKAFNMTSILDGVPIQEEIITTQLFRMFYNALISPAISSKAFALLKDGSVDVTYAIDENYLGFQHLLGLKFETAVLDAVPGTTLKAPDNSLKAGMVSIAGIDYEYSDDANEFLGYSVNYFYRETSNKRRELVYMYKSDRNEELVLTHDIILDFSSGVYTYEHNNSTRKVRISGIPIFNGVANTYYKDEEMKPAFGKVTFINNDNDSDYDVVKIDSYKFYISTKVMANDKILYGEDINGNSVPIDLSKADALEIWDKGKSVDFERVKSKQLLAIRESSNSTPGFKKYIIECQSPEKSNAQVTAIKKDAITIGGSVLNLWDGIKDKLEMGKTYNVYAWQDVVVFVMEIEQAGFSTAYLIDYGVKDEGFGEKTAQIALLDIDLNYHVYDVYEKVRVDEVPYSKTTLENVRGALMSSALLSAGYTDKYPLAQPVKISFNSKGQINKIDTYTYNEGEEEETSLRPAITYDTDGNSMIIGNKSLRYNSRNTSFHDMSSMAGDYNRTIASVGNARKLLVPNDDRTEIDSYSTTSSLVNGTNYVVDFVGIDEKTGLAEIIFVYTNVSELTTTSPVIVADLYEQINENGDAECIAEVYQGANLVAYICEKDIYDTLKIGDVYNFVINKKNVVLNKAKRFSPVEGISDTNLVAAGGVATILHEVGGSIAGTPLSLASGMLRLALIKPENINQGTEWKNVASDFFNIASAPVFKFLKVNGAPKVEKISVSEMITYTQDPLNPSFVIINKAGSTTAAGQVYIIEQ